MIGQRVVLSIPGEETGWDEDRGRPEHIGEDRKITGRISHLGRERPDGNRQVRIDYEDSDGDLAEAWGWIYDCEAAT